MSAEFENAQEIGMTSLRSAQKTSPAVPALPRVLPFAVFMAFIGVNELLQAAAARGLVQLGPTTLQYLYPLKTVAVAWLLYRYRGEYREFNVGDLKRPARTAAVALLGIVVFLLWIGMGWTLTGTAAPAGYNPTLFPDPALRIGMTLFRIAGAVLVVPLMEELFWRSFLIRYLIDNDFGRVAVGTFTWGSFLITVALFGVEHTFVYAGIMAGAIYNLILYQTRSLSQCVLAHAVTNLALAVYVVLTGNWQFW